MQMHWSSPRSLLAAACVALTVGACTTEEQSTIGPAVSTTTSAPTTTAPPTTTTTAPPTTPPTTAAPTTTTTTTTPSGPSNALVPLLVGGDPSTGWLFLGAWQQNGWQESVDPSGNPIRPGLEAGTEVTVTNLDGERPGVLGAPVEACFDERVGPLVDSDVGVPDPPGFGYGALAMVGHTWPLKPRPVATVAAPPAAYQSIGEAAFAGEPVDATLGSVEELVVADLDGDGDDEALASFEFVQPGLGPGTPGDLTAFLLVDTDARAGATVLRSVVTEEFTTILERFRVVDVADLNGDGRMEVIVHAWYYEGASVIVYEYDGSQLIGVLATGCGA